MSHSASFANPPRIALLSSAGDQIRDTLDAVRPHLAPHATIVAEDLENRQDLSKLQLDFVVVFGGDGSILRSAQQMGHRQLPVLGVNLGRLGFLADLSTGELIASFPQICQGQIRVHHHLMLNCTVLRNGVPVAQRLSLNEVAVLGGPPYSLLEIELSVDGDWATTYSCDGLIISTPVGSTAHNLSAGGPILRKDLQAVVISPISPHTLTVRPVVDSANSTYEISVRRRHSSVLDDQIAVVVDGMVAQVLATGDRVVVQRAAPTFQLIEIAGRGYYRTLREKLGWSGEIRRTQPN